MEIIYPHLSVIVAILGIYAMSVIDRILELKTYGRRYLPPQRMVTCPRNSVPLPQNMQSNMTN